MTQLSGRPPKSTHSSKIGKADKYDKGSHQPGAALFVRQAEKLERKTGSVLRLDTQLFHFFHRQFFYFRDQLIIHLGQCYQLTSGVAFTF